MAHASGRSYPIAATLGWSMILQQFLHEQQTVHEQSEQLMQLSATQGFPQWVALGQVLQGWARSAHEHSAEATVPMRQALAAFQASGTRLALPYFLGLLADVYRRQGDRKDGLAAVADAFAVIEETGERFYEAELYRLKGELTLQEANQKSKVKVQNAKVSDTQSSVLSPQSLPSPQASSLKPQVGWSGRRRSVSSKPSPSPANRKQSRWSCGR